MKTILDRQQPRTIEDRQELGELAQPRSFDIGGIRAMAHVQAVIDSKMKRLADKVEFQQLHGGADRDAWISKFETARITLQDLKQTLGMKE